MNRISTLFEKISKIQYRITSNNKKPRKFGTEHLLYHSEIHFINSLPLDEGLNVTQIAERLGVTKGAVTQVSDKLLKKKLITKYKEEFNQKEVYVKLTVDGKKAYKEHKKHHHEISMQISKYMDSLSDKQINAIFGLVDIIDTNLENLNKE